MASQETPLVSFEVNGETLACSSEGTLLDALKSETNFSSVKDGCSPQGQCGCCTVLVDGVARVSCVTPLRRVAGRTITTLEGVDPLLRQRLFDAFECTGASQCGFCTPGILVRLCGLARKGSPTESQVRTALGAHLCRCTGFQSIVDAALLALHDAAEIPVPRDPEKASARATLESGTRQHIGVDVMEGAAGFAIDTYPPQSLVAVATSNGEYVVGESERSARALSGKVQGRNSSVPLRASVTLPEIDGSILTLQTTFVEPGYVESDTSWCEPGGTPASAFANAGAFGAKRHSRVGQDAARLAEEYKQSVVAIWPREEVVRRGAKRPPIALSLRGDGSGSLRIGRTPDSDDLTPLCETLREKFDKITVEVVDIVGPRVGATHRGAVIAELLAAKASLHGVAGAPIEVEALNGARASVAKRDDGSLEVRVAAGDPLCDVTLESYIVGAVHQGLGMVTSEGIAVDEEGEVHDLTIRSFGILSASQMPRVHVVIEDDPREALACGVAVLAATMAVHWVASGRGPVWPIEREVVA